jgi:ribosomal protein S21
MIIINVTKERNIDSALKKLKYKFNWTKKELLKNKEFEKKSVSLRNEKNRAQYVQKIKDKEQRD